MHNSSGEHGYKNKILEYYTTLKYVYQARQRRKNRKRVKIGTKRPGSGANPLPGQSDDSAQ